MHSVILNMPANLNEYELRNLVEIVSMYKSLLVFLDTILVRLNCSSRLCVAAIFIGA